MENLNTFALECNKGSDNFLKIFGMKNSKKLKQKVILNSI